jgi:hypothetical protein
MAGWRGLIVALLVYITLDLSLPSIPGAFAFEPSDSIESTCQGRARAATAVVALPVLPVERPTVEVPRPGVRGRVTSVRVVARHRPRVLPRTAPEPAPPTDDH